MWVAAVFCGAVVLRHCVLAQQFVRIGDEVEEGLEVGFVFSFIEFIVEGAFFGVGLVFFFLFDEKFGGEDFAAEVAVVEGGVVDAFVECLQLRYSEFCRQ